MMLKNSIKGERIMNGKIRMIGRILAACALCLFLVQGAWAGTAHEENKARDKAARMELKALHQKEKTAKSPEERGMIRAQRQEKAKQMQLAKQTERAAAAKKGVK
jgi:hypothetical protein